MVTYNMSLISKIFWFTIHVDSWFWRIIDRICWVCAIFCSIPNLQARTDKWINLGWAGEPTLPPGTLAAHGLEEHVQVSLIFAIIISFMLTWRNRRLPSPTRINLSVCSSVRLSVRACRLGIEHKMAQAQQIWSTILQNHESTWIVNQKFFEIKYINESKHSK